MSDVTLPAVDVTRHTGSLAHKIVNIGSSQSKTVRKLPSIYLFCGIYSKNFTERDFSVIIRTRVGLKKKFRFGLKNLLSEQRNSHFT